MFYKAMKKSDSDKCRHKASSKCGGTGLNKYTGELCVHMLVCYCRFCAPTYYKPYKTVAASGGETGV